MFDFAWSEILVISVVALVVIGPKDLPRVMRSLGVWLNRARAIAREFQSSLDQMMREAELDEVRKQVEDAAKIDIKQEVQQAIDPGRELERTLSERVEVETSAPAATFEPPAPTPEAEPSILAPSAEEDTVEPAKSGTHA